MYQSTKTQGHDHPKYKTMQWPDRRHPHASQWPKPAYQNQCPSGVKGCCGHNLSRLYQTLTQGYPITFLLGNSMLLLPSKDVPLAKNPSTGTAQQRLFLVLKVVLYAVVVISEVLRLNTMSRCSRCCRAHLYCQGTGVTNVPLHYCHSCALSSLA